MFKDFFGMMFGVNMNDHMHLAAQIIPIYQRHAKAWTDLRGQLLYEKTWLDRIAVPQFFTRGSSFELPLVLWVFYRVKIKLLKFFFQTNSLELF